MILMMMIITAFAIMKIILVKVTIILVIVVVIAIVLLVKIINLTMKVEHFSNGLLLIIIHYSTQ